MYRKIVSVFILMAFIAYLGGCSSMRYLPKDQFSEVDQKKDVWVTTVDKKQYKIIQPKIKGSQLCGIAVGDGYKEFDFSEIESIGIKETDKNKTFAVSAMGIAGLVFLISVMNDGSDSCNT